MLRLHVTPAQGDPFERELANGDLVIGRSASAGLTLSDPFLSRQQARLFQQEGRWWIEDLGSRNGTWVDGRRIEEPTPVRPGSSISFSQSRITVLADVSASPADGSEEAVAEAVGSSATTHPFGSTVFRPAAEVLAEEAPPVEVHDAETLRRHAERLRLLTEVHRALGRSIALEELLQLILDRVFELLEPEEGVIFLRNAEGELEPAARRSLSREGKAEEDEHEDEDLVLRSRTLEREVVDKRLAALALDTRHDTRFAKAESLLDYGIRSLLAAPLLAEEGEALGMIVLTSGRHVRLYTDEDLSLLVSLASVAALRIQNVALAREAFERRRFEREVALARRIQVALLADVLPEISGWEIHAGNRPSQGVSGDVYQVLERAGRLVLMVVDVAGKGISASLLTATLEALAAGPIERGQPPEEIASWLSRQLQRRTPPEKYATLFLGVLDPTTGLLRWVNAGHPPALVMRHPATQRRGATDDLVIEHLEATGPPVGLLSDDRYEAKGTRLAPGDTLVLYTDGITEAADPKGRELGVEGLEEVCRRHGATELDDLAEELDRTLEEFTGGAPPEDDRTLVLVRRRGTG